MPLKARELERLRAGRRARLKAEVFAVTTGAPVGDVPLFSHDATIQSTFTKGWHSVSPIDIRLALGRQLNGDYSNHKDLGAVARANIQHRLGRTGGRHGHIR